MKIIKSTVAILSILFLIIFASHNIFAATNYVSKTGGHISPFSSWANAATNIQDAVDVLFAGDIVLVSNGIYDTGGRHTPGYYCFNRVVISTEITVKSVNGPENTFIVGNGPLGANAVRGVYMSAGLLAGFTITNGHTMLSGHYNYDCNGGGVNMYGGNGMITNCIIIGNSADNGGGTFYGTINNSTFVGNSAVNNGGGINYGTVNNSTIVDNSADESSGGVFYGTVNNCTISRNVARWAGGTASGTINNSIIIENSAVEAGGTYGGIINNSIVYYNFAPDNSNRYSGTYNYCCSTHDSTNGIGNISVEPMLLSSSHIATNSPCIGAGSTNYISGVDIDGEHWKNPPSMGCDEVYASSISGSLSVAIIADSLYSHPNIPLDFRVDISGKLYQNIWDFKNGKTETNKLKVSHSWNSLGDFDVILTAFNETYPAGVSDTVTVHIVTNVYYVNIYNSTPVLPYSSWETAAINIQDAVDTAYIGGNIFVTNGTYVLSSQIDVDKSLIIESINGPKKTIVDGNNSNRCFYLYNHSTLLSGFTVTNGISNIGSSIGGGIYCSGITPTITNCIISGNHAASGGGIYYGTINNCLISLNYAYHAGGIYRSVVNNCIISDNSADYDGAGTYESINNNCIISGNLVKWENGGGTYESINNNCIISENYAKNGGGVYGGNINNCTISRNSANRGGGTYGGIINNSIIYYNFAPANSNRYSGTYNYCCTTHDSTNGIGNISLEPMFVSSSHIATNSPCIGAGSTNYISGVDIDGEHWKNPPSIGCDEVYANSVSGSLFVVIIADDVYSHSNIELNFSADISGNLFQNLWDFGDGKTETNKLKVSHSWNSLGDYDVILTAFNDTYPGGISDTITVHVITNVNFVNINNSTPVFPYSSWDTSATNIQDAVDATYNGGKIFVTNGTYFLSSPIDVKKSLVIESINGPDNTIVDGNSSVRCFHLYNQNTFLSGFTVRNGSAMGGGDGGGIYCTGTKPIISNCFINGNWTGWSGGGTVYGTFNNCIISGNMASDNGGGTAYGTFNNCIISGNSAKNGGGTYYTIVNCSTISGNSAKNDGGGSFRGSINNSTIDGNSAKDEGGGTYVCIVNNCTIVGNSGAERGGGTYNCTVNNSIVYFNSAIYGSNRYIGTYQEGTYNYCCTTPEGTNGIGNILAKPLLVSNSHIATNSPCIGAGSASYSSGVDIDGETWKAPPSIGCDEAYANSISGSLSVTIIADKIYSYPNNLFIFRADIFGKLYQSIWNFGNGKTESNKLEVSHSWSSVGDYEVILTAFNDTYPVGVSDTITVHVITNVHFVNINNSTPVFPYSSWETAATNIQDAVDVAYNGGKVFVTNGIYVLNSRIDVDKNLIIESINGPENTIVDGNNTNGCFNLYNYNTLLYGFTITNGHANGYDYGYGSGGGVCCSGIIPIITNCVINGNFAEGGGGGICYGTINNCLISGNIAEYNGGGVANGMINNCIINRNMSALDGGGIAEAIINNCIISENVTELSGGGTSYCTVNNCTIVGNSATGRGGGTQAGVANNSTITGNTAGYRGGGTYSGTVKNSIIYYNSALEYTNRYSGTYNYCCTTFDSITGTGNISVEPMLASASHIATNSPCIGAGYSSYSSGVDIDGEIWKNPPAIGCDEVYANTISGSLFVDIVVDRKFSYPNVSFGFRTDISGKLYQSIWDFGNENMETNKPFVSYAWSSIGDYEIALTAFNNTYPGGISDTITVHVITNVHFVNINNTTPVFPYSSWDTSATNIQDAVDAAYSGGKIIVTNGTYFLSSQIDVDKNLVIESMNGPENTIIDGNNSNRCFNLYNHKILLSGFTITNGNVVDYEDGGGIYCSDVTPIITNCIIRGNFAEGNGGGAFFGNIINCTISRNMAWRGGGTYESTVNNCLISENTANYGGGSGKSTVNNSTIIGNSAVSGAGTAYGVISNTTIHGNSSSDYGGGIYKSTVDNCMISENTARNKGGGIYNGTVNNCTISRNSANYGSGTYDSTANNCIISSNSASYGGGSHGGLINSCIISRNIASVDGGGTYISIINNCLISENIASDDSGGIYGGTVNNCIICKNIASYGGGARNGTINNSIIWDNFASMNSNFFNSTIRYTCTSPLPSGEGNISNNPEFISFSDFHLQVNSPCIDSGNNSYAPMPWDLDGDPRIMYGTVDMGCYEFVPEPCSYLFIVYYLSFIFCRRKY